MKLRFEVHYKLKRPNKKNTHNELDYINLGLTIKSSILMKEISYYAIGKDVYKKPSGESDLIQQFYHSIIRNKLRITEIRLVDKTHYYLKEAKLHSYNGCYCYYSRGYPKVYAINGILIPGENARAFSIRTKIEYIKSNIKNEQRKG